MNGDHSSFQSGLHPETSTVAEADLRFSDRRLPPLRGIFFKLVLQCRIALGMLCVRLHLSPVVTRQYLTSQIRLITEFANAMSYSNPEADRLFAEAAASLHTKQMAESIRRSRKLWYRICLASGSMSPSISTFFRPNSKACPIMSEVGLGILKVRGG